MWQAPEIVSTVLSTAANYNLVDLPTVKDELSITSTSNDTWLTRAIAQVSKAIMNDTNRVFAPEYLQDVFAIDRMRSQVPGGVRQLQLSRWPVLAVSSAVQTSAELNTPVTLVEGTDFRVNYDTGQLLRLNSDTGLVSAWEALPVTVSYSAGYGAAVAETHTVPSTPFQVTVTQSSSFSCDQTVTYANGILLVPVASNPAQGQYSVAAGLYTFNSADAGQVLTFNYCTSNPPDDIEDVCLQLITGRFRARGRDPSLVQRETPGVGIERFWFGSAPGQTGPFPAAIEGLLDNYKVPVIA